MERMASGSYRDHFDVGSSVGRGGDDVRLTVRYRLSRGYKKKPDSDDKKHIRVAVR
jgi:hypothetical protein